MSVTQCSKYTVMTTLLSTPFLQTLPISTGKNYSMLITHWDFVLKSVLDGGNFMSPVLCVMNRQIQHIIDFAAIICAQGDTSHD